MKGTILCYALLPVHFHKLSIYIFCNITFIYHPNMTHLFSRTTEYIGAQYNHDRPDKRYKVLTQNRYGFQSRMDCLLCTGKKTHIVFIETGISSSVAALHNFQFSADKSPILGNEEIQQRAYIDQTSPTTMQILPTAQKLLKQYRITNNTVT